MTKIATREAYGKALVELGRQNSQVVVLDADLSKSTMTRYFAQEFPERFFNMGIAEQSLMATAAGLGLSGKIPFASTFAVFATGRAYDQVRNGIAYPKVNVKIAATHAGLTVGEDGASHQAVEDVTLMRAIPNMTVIVPADGEETRQAVFAAAAYQGPVYIRLGRPAVPVIYNEDYRFQIGRAHTLRRGKDAAIIACGVMVHEALRAAEELAAAGLEVMVVNMSTIKPLDREAVLAAAATGAVVTAEEHTVIGGLGSAVAEVLATERPVPLAMVGIRDTFGESGKPDELMAKYGLTARDIVAAVKRLKGKKD
ncbi:transketolase [Moorella thermoacetica]|uniref:1-deoxy-D-xylulose-5-phosphate synthase n=3 Tax=Neomoorella thermoacetica TaxID=1525 RepID=A0AAC9HFF3_NEOTH|nr:transketolase family protein [Moorella thermoacetica]AKX93068.1 1-deoxy-D-xylulose-5-phosphate synthase [Moorella thermoacetica]AKX95619.1 1-deoxy-D-xylulose-5-phosphate synthase [Moorella thermoacetica]AOQ22736.1 1-deoxy-D-xylulose-5-phosphate synthase [Moorella thermoacetica]OIQ53670.1 1-deoxy-D-xylulose-5-phosphate synthase [Moorella thermoacetica]OIQ58918.1 1-deoxy-D-xylulose-5-phosphate synthase [Moorella thermoacetica]